MTQHLFRAAERKRKAHILKPRLIRRLRWRYRLWQIKRNQTNQEKSNV